ncbi:MAG: YgiQ family radical SAM protein [Acetobacter sp.]|nr:YgiQ family radical SAM protein [Bacteroides sp.]MCM1341368.1 YgiQ family radical SAM protein [Acetobacter sp.]
MNSFLPINKKEMLERGWDSVDFVYVTGDAYVDHPSFGASIITRVLENKGYRVAVLSQPNWKNHNDFMQFGKPRLAFFVTSGNIDSMVAHYTAAKRKRHDDAYTAGGVSGKRPDRAVIVYSNIIKEIYPDSPVIIGGLEASLRRFAHYDYWDDAVRPSILIDSKADLLSFGMGENQTIEIARRLNNGEKISDMRDIRGTVYACPTRETTYEGVECPSYDNVLNSKKEYAKSCRIQQDEQDHIRGKVIKQKHGKIMIVQNKPMPPLTQKELDWVYSLPYARAYHPSYEKLGGVPGIREVEFSITHNRGCFGACNFCSIAFHQGRYVTSRSKKSLMIEAEKLTHMPNFKGYIHDVGGPTANFRKPSCELQEEHGLCKGRKCLAPKPCSNLIANHSEYLDILRSLRSIGGIKKVFIRSGIRYDYLLQDKDDSFFKELVEHHVSGQLKVAPEHCSASVLDKMGKPHIEAYIDFSRRYFQYTGQINKEQYLVPYLMSSHPGSTLDDAIELALFLKKNHIRPEQVQDFYPTPGTISTCMFYTELDPYTMENVYVAKSEHDKALQRALLQYFNPKNQHLVAEALKKARRFDLIGYDNKCLIKPISIENQQKKRYNKNRQSKYSSRKNTGKRNKK